MAKHPRVLLAVCGKTNSGKTYLVQNDIIPHLPKPVFIIDSEKEYEIENSVVFEDFKDLHGYISRGMKKNTIVIFRPKTKNDKDVELLFYFLSRIDSELSLIVEEAGNYMDSHNVDEHLSEMMFQGAHRGHSLIFISQRPTQLHNNVFSQCTGVVSFLQTGRGDINKLRDFDDEKAKRVNQLDHENYEYVALGFLPKKFPELKKKLGL